MSEPPAKIHRSEAEWRAQLTPEQYRVIREKDTERPFTGALTQNHESGNYHCAGCGALLFLSGAKFDSGCGWPSFSRPLEGKEVVGHTDVSHGMERTEVRSKTADSHLGHVFDDGPGPTHLRYCINSASLRFIPVEEMKKAGYGAYLDAFVKAGVYKPAEGKNVEASKR